MASTSTPAFRMEIVLRADPLTAIMLGMVTFISTLVVIYSSGYMHGDPATGGSSPTWPCSSSR